MFGRRLIAVGLCGAAGLVFAACGGETKPATNVTSTSATLNAHASCHAGESGKWWFRWRPTGNPWRETPRNSYDCATDDAQDVSADLTGLTPATEYEYQVCVKPTNPFVAVCANADGHADNADRDPGEPTTRFTTLSGPPQPRSTFNTAVSPPPATGGIVVRSDTAVSTFTTSPPSSVPHHIETWAYDDGWPEGGSASSALVAKWVTYAEGFGGSKPVDDCHSTGAICRSLAYFDPHRIYDCAGCSVPLSLTSTPENWWLHIPGYSDSAHRIRASDNGTTTANLPNLTLSAVRDWFANYARANDNAYDGFMVDDTPATLAAELYPSGYETSNELTTDAQVASGESLLAAALTHNDGTPFIQVDNGISPNHYLPPGFNRLNNAGVTGLVTEGVPILGGSFTGYYNTMLDEMAYINTQASRFMVLLSYSDSGSLQARRDQAATILLGYSPGHEVSWSNLNQNSADLAIWPEEGIYPTQPVQSMSAPGGSGCLNGSGSDCSSGGHNSVEVASGVYRREFSSCYNQGVAFGRCAVIVNWNGSAVTTQSNWLTNSYSHQVTMVGGDVQAGGTINLNGAGYGPGTSIPAHDSVILTQ